MISSVGYIKNNVGFAANAQKAVAAPQANFAEVLESAAKGSAANSRATTPTAPQAASTYDFTSMTPNQMQDVAKELVKSGKFGDKISPETLRLQMIGMPIVRDNYSPAQLAEYANRPVNYIQEIQGQLEFLKHAGNADERISVQDLLATLQSMQGKTSA